MNTPIRRTFRISFSRFNQFVTKSFHFPVPTTLYDMIKGVHGDDAEYVLNSDSTIEITHTVYR